MDLVPKSYGGRHVYWRWSMEQTPDWYAIPHARRWMVPEAVVRAFEYRPEILLLE